MRCGFEYKQERRCEMDVENMQDSEASDYEADAFCDAFSRNPQRLIRVWR